MKKYLSKKFLVKFLITSTVAFIASVVVWEGTMREPVTDWYTFEAVVEHKEKTPATIDEMIEEMARDFLKSDEAFEWAKQEVTKDTVEELSKL